MAGLVVKKLKNSSEQKSPNTAKASQLKNISSMPLWATLSAASRLPSPSRRLKRAFTPTLVPTATAMVSICTG